MQGPKNIYPQRAPEPIFYPKDKSTKERNATNTDVCGGVIYNNTHPREYFTVIRKVTWLWARVLLQGNIKLKN